jgi:hypothetical protein
MGTYHEYRAPQGAPADGERDAWLEDGKLVIGHYVSATGTWSTDRTIDYANITGVEPSFSKNTGFNKNFGDMAGTVAEGNHGHGGTFAGDADTVDGKHASEFASAQTDTWHKVGAGGEPAYMARWQARGTDDNDNIWFTKRNGFVFVQGAAKFIYAYAQPDLGIFTLPAGYRPSQNIYGGTGYIYIVNGHDACFPTLPNMTCLHGGTIGFPFIQDVMKMHVAQAAILVQTGGVVRTYDSFYKGNLSDNDEIVISVMFPI